MIELEVDEDYLECRRCGSDAVYMVSHSGGVGKFICEECGASGSVQNFMDDEDLVEFGLSDV